MATRRWCTDLLNALDEVWAKLVGEALHKALQQLGPHAAGLVDEQASNPHELYAIAQDLQLHRLPQLEEAHLSPFQQVVEGLIAEATAPEDRREQRLALLQAHGEDDEGVEVEQDFVEVLSRAAVLDHPLVSGLQCEAFLRALRFRIAEHFAQTPGFASVGAACTAAAPIAPRGRPLVLWDVENLNGGGRYCNFCFAGHVIREIALSTSWPMGSFDVMSVCAHNRFRFGMRGFDGLVDAGVIPVVCKAKKEAADHMIKDLITRHLDRIVAVVSDDNDFRIALGSLSAQRDSPVYLFRTAQVAETRSLLQLYSGLRVCELGRPAVGCVHPSGGGQQPASHSGESVHQPLPPVSGAGPGGQQAPMLPPGEDSTAAVGPGSPSPAALASEDRFPIRVLQVQQGRIASEAFAKAWEKHSGKTANTKDPITHDVKSLEAFLTRAPQVLLEDRIEETLGLVQAVNERRERNKRLAKAWNCYCNDYGGGNNNPAMKRPEFLRHFVGQHPMPQPQRR